MFAEALAGLQQSLTFWNLLVMVLGMAGGIAIGAMPGLSATLGIAVMIPFTFGMPPATGLLMLGAIYTGAIYGGSISAITIRTPGTPAAVATALDGHALAQKGQAQEALVASVTSSAIGGILGNVGLLFFAPPLAAFALRFGPPEFFWLAIFGLTIIAGLSPRALVKGFIGGAFGLFLSTVGLDPVTGYPRFTFGISQLQGGVELISAMIGFFSIPQALSLLEKEERYSVVYAERRGVILPTIRRILKMPRTLSLGTLIGLFVGILPGAGSTIAALVGYSEAKRFSPARERFGTGEVEGVVAPETANNACIGGDLIPTLTLGIPGSAPAAALLGGLLIHGIQPGYDLFTKHGQIAFTFIMGLFVANLLMLAMGLLGVRLFVQVLRVPNHYLAPSIIVLSVVGSFAIRNQFTDVAVMFGAGLLGYVFRRTEVDVAAVVLGLILGNIAEEGFLLSIRLGTAQGSVLAYFFGRPISAVLIVICLLSAASAVFLSYWYARRVGVEADD